MNYNKMPVWHDCLVPVAISKHQIFSPKQVDLELLHGISAIVVVVEIIGGVALSYPSQRA